MDTLLKQLPLTTDQDVICALEFGIALLREANIPSSQVIEDGFRIGRYCRQSLDDDAQVSFSLLEENDAGWLRVSTGRQDEGIRAALGKDFSNEQLSRVVAEACETASERERRYQDMRQFSLALAHELKNSITKIKMAVSLVEQEEMPEDVTNYVQVIHRASARLEHTMAGLSDIIKFGHSAGVVNAISPLKIFEEVREDFGEMLSGVGATVDVSFENIGEISYVDSYLRSIFTNLMSNAIKYAAPERPLHLTLAGCRQNSYVLLHFSDNGRGIDLARTGDKLFHPFSRFSNNTEGTGLGLYLVRNIVERNGGRIEVSSEPGAGASFHFFLREYEE